MKKQLQIGFIVVLVLLVLESVRALAGTVGQIEIKIVTQDRPVEVSATITATSSGVLKQTKFPTVTPEMIETTVRKVFAQPTSTSERPEILPSSTPRVTYTPVPTEKPARRKTPDPSSSDSAADSSTSTPEASATGVLEITPTSPSTIAPLPTSAPMDPAEETPGEPVEVLPTDAPTPGGM